MTEKPAPKKYGTPEEQAEYWRMVDRNAALDRPLETLAGFEKAVRMFVSGARRDRAA